MPNRAASDADLRQVVDQHASGVYRVARAIVRDDALADDVVQETMVKAWRYGPRDDDGQIPKAWLYKVARNAAISLLRRRREDLRDPSTMGETIDGGASTDRTVEGRLQLEDLWDAMATLQPEARTLIALREVDGLSYEDIAETLDLPLPTVKTRLFRARRDLKVALKEWR